MQSNTIIYTPHRTLLHLWRWIILLFVGVSTLSAQSRADWMARMSDTVRLSDLNIPGSRQSTYLQNAGFFTSWYYIQSGSIAEHLDRGVRALDLWLKADGEQGLKVYYDKDSRPAPSLSEGVLAPVSLFLKEHPSETVILFVRAETDTEALGAKLDASLSQYADKGYVSGIKPDICLADVRGRFFVVRCGAGVASASSKDLSVAGLWARDAETVSTTLSQSTNTAPLHIADYYRQNGLSRDWSTKQSSLTKNLDDAAASKQGVWYLSFSGFERTSVGPAEFSRSINPFLTERFTQTPDAKTGIVMLDFILGSSILGNKDFSTEETLAAIVASNKRHVANKWIGAKSSDMKAPENWAAGRPIPSDGTANLFIDPAAIHPISITDTVSYLSIENPGPIGIAVHPGALLRVLEDIRCPQSRSGIRLRAASGKAMGRLFFAKPKTAQHTIVETEALPRTQTLERWEYLTPLVEKTIPQEVFGKRSIRLWDGKEWQPTDSTAVQPAFQGLAVATDKSSKPYLYKGILAAGDHTVKFEASSSGQHRQEFVGNSFVSSIPISRIDLSESVEPCYYTIVSTPLSDYFAGKQPAASTSIGCAVATPRAFAGLHGLPSLIEPGDAFFVFARGGSLTLPYADPLSVPAGELPIAPKPIPALTADLLTSDGKIIDRVWLFFDPSYTTQYDRGYDAFKLHAPDRAEITIGSEQGALQVAALPTPALSRFFVRPASDSRDYQLHFTAYDGAEALVHGYNIVDHYSGQVSPLEIGKSYKIEMQAGDKQRSYTIGTPTETNVLSLQQDALSCILLPSGDALIRKPQGSTDVRVYNALGLQVRVYSLSPEAQTVTIPLTSLPKGLYIMQVQAQTGTVSQRFVR